MNIFCIGLNHETAPVSLREKLAFAENSLSEALQWLRQQPEIQEALVLSTCNRVEFYFVANSGSIEGRRPIIELLAQRTGNPKDQWEPFLYQHTLHDAIAHLFRVTSGMDSMVIGEPQITGQVKDAYRNAMEEKTLGSILNRMLHKSFSVSKRVRTETELASRAVSVSYVAVELAKKIFGDLHERTVLLAGAGEMAELAATHLVSHGVARILVASRTLENARSLASRFRGEAVRLDSIPEHLSDTDILICSTAAPDYILRYDQVREALRARKQKPVFIIDIAVPRNIDPKVNELEHVYLYDMDDLQRVLKSNLEERKKELKKAESIVQEELHEFIHWLKSLDLVPTIISLRDRAEKIRQQELQKALALLKNTVEPKQQKVIEALSHAIVNKILHRPISELKQAEKRGESADLSDAIHRLFVLDPDRKS